MVRPPPSKKKKLMNYDEFDGICIYVWNMSRPRRTCKPGGVQLDDASKAHDLQPAQRRHLCFSGPGGFSCPSSIVLFCLY